MSEEKILQEGTQSAELDESLDVLALVRTAKAEEGATTIETAPVEKSPVEQMLEAKSNGVKGMVVTEAEFQKEEAGPTKDHTQMPETEQGVQSALAEMDAMISVLEKNPIPSGITNPQARMDIINNVSAVAEKVLKGEEVPEGIDLVNGGTKRAIENDEAEYANDEDEDDADSTETKPISAEKQEIVNILIDKTGLGANIELTEEERSKLSVASKIRVTEVENKEIQSLVCKKSERSFLETISEYKTDGVITPVILPASRLKLSMRGLTFGEMGDISVNPENISYEQLNKKLSIIHKCMANSSVSGMDDYETFLKNIAYTDIDMCVFGIICATFPETDTVTLQCRIQKCRKEFEASYRPRALLRWDNLDERTLNAYKEVSTCGSPEEFKEQHEKSSVMNIKKITLPESKFIVEIGVASAHDYMHGIADLILGEKFKEKYPDDINGMKAITATFLTVVRAVAVPSDNNKYDRFDVPEDVLEALYRIKPGDFNIILKIMTQYSEAFKLAFAINEVKCPYCGAVTNTVKIDINDLVFTKFQTLNSTDVDLSGILVI